jgi:hypothetical protein
MDDKYKVRNEANTLARIKDSIRDDRVTQIPTGYANTRCACCKMDSDGGGGMVEFEWPETFPIGDLFMPRMPGLRVELHYVCSACVQEHGPKADVPLFTPLEPHESSRLKASIDALKTELAKGEGPPCVVNADGTTTPMDKTRIPGGLTADQVAAVEAERTKRALANARKVQSETLAAKVERAKRAVKINFVNQTVIAPSNVEVVIVGATKGVSVSYVEAAAVLTTDPRADILARLDSLEEKATMDGAFGVAFDCIRERIALSLGMRKEE